MQAPYGTDKASESSEILVNLEGSFSAVFDLLDRRIGTHLSKHEALARNDVEYCKLCDDAIDDSLSRQWQRAGLEDFGFPSLRGVLHRHHHPGARADEIHSPAHAFDHLSWDDPVS